MIVQFRRVAEFNRVVFHGPGLLQIEQGDAESLSVEAPGNIISEIKSGVVSGTLSLGYQSGVIARLDVHQAPIKFKLVVRELNLLSVAGSGSVDILDLDTDHFVGKLLGNGTIVIKHLTADHLTLDITAQGRLRVLGDVESQQVSVSDSGRYEAEELVSDSADIRITGNGSAEIRVTDDLTTYIGGQSTLGYIGYPVVVKQGAGTIVRRRNQLPQSERGSEHG